MKDANAWNTIRNLNWYIKDDDAVMMYTEIVDDDLVLIEYKESINDVIMTYKITYEY